MRRHCPHNPATPILQIALKRTPLTILKKITKRVAEFYANPATLTCLTARARKLKRPARMKSQRREGVIQVIIALLHYTDLATMRVGIPTARGFKPLGVRFFVKLTGLSQSRFERALADINAAGVIKTHQRHRRGKNGDYIGLNAVRVVSTQLFTALGLGKYLKEVRVACSKKLLKLAETNSVAKMANLVMISQGRQARHQRAKIRPPPTAPPSVGDETANQHLIALKRIFGA
jgi:hypothetical protein